MARVADPPATAGRTWSLRRGAMVFAVVVLIELVVLACWSVYQAVAARGELEDARAAAGQAQDALTGLDVDMAAAELQRAYDGFASGYDRLSGPVVRAASLLPMVGDDAATVRTLAWGGREVAAAGLEVLDTVEDVGGMPAFMPRGGRLPVDAVAALAEPSARAHEQLRAAVAAVQQTPTSDLLPVVSRARDQFLDQAVDAEQLMGTAAQVTGVVPGILGGEGTRRYLFAAQNPAELRGTGGYMGAYSVLEVEDGQLSFSRFIPIQELTSLHVSQVDPPNADFAARYDRFGGAGSWEQINLTPDFPSAAAAIEQLWEATEGSDVDGVIAVDPLAFEALLRLSGPVQMPGFGAVGADEVVEVVVNEAYGVFDDHDERKEVLGAIAAGALRGVLAGDGVDPMEAADALLDVAGSGHLKMYLTTPQEQQLLEDFGIAGQLLDPPGDYLSVVVNSASRTKLDYFTERDVYYRVHLHPDGSADGEARVALRNSAPTSGLPQRVIGPGGGLEVGENRSYVSVFCDVGCQLDDTDGHRVEEELGHGVASAFVTVESGATAEMATQWHSPDAWDPDSGVYRLAYQAQTTLQPTTLHVEVIAPEGYRLGRQGHWSGAVEGTHRIELPLVHQE